MIFPKDSLDSLINNGPSLLKIKHLLIRSSGTGEDSTGKVAFALKDDTTTEFLLIMAVSGEAAMNELLDMVRSSLSLLEGGSLQLYRTPADTVVKKDKWWDKRYPKNSDKAKVKAAAEELVGEKHSQNPYSAYRDTIDFLIVDKVEWLIRSNLMTENAPLNVAELCGGDGSLAVHVTDQLESHSVLGSYTLLERNKVLMKNAATKLQAKWGDRARLLTVDTALDAGQELIGSLDPPPDLWIASGSTLCGQVGSAAMAEPTLLRMALALRPGGFMVITGFTTTFFTPSLFAKARLTVHHSSIPSAETSGLETDCGLFHMWVLEKKKEEDES